MTCMPLMRSVVLLLSALLAVENTVSAAHGDMIAQEFRTVNPQSIHKSRTSGSVFSFRGGSGTGKSSGYPGPLPRQRRDVLGRGQRGDKGRYENDSRTSKRGMEVVRQKFVGHTRPKTEDRHQAPGEHEPHGDMSVTTAIVNMVADLCPHGMLPVAYGMAAGGGTGLAVAPALLAAFGIVSCYTMVSIGRACERTRRWSFGGLWTDLVGKESAWVVEVAVSVMCFGCCIFYSAFIGDLFSALAGSASFVPEVLKKRAIDLLVLSLFPLLPLCLMKNLSALQYTSCFGLVSIMYTVAFVVKRSLDGTYAEGGAFFKAIDPKFRSPVASPWATVKLWRVGPGLVTLMNMACVAFMAHYNGVKYYEELENRDVKKYTTTIGTAMTISLGVFCTMMLFGFRTFGPAAQALILNNYHRTADPLASLARLATGFSILCGYPLMFAALKSSFFNAAAEISAKFGENGETMAHRFLRDEKLRTSCILSLLAVITAIACNQSEEDVAVIVGLIGALLGSGANYIIPAIFNLSLLRRAGARRGVMTERTLNKAIIIFGVVFMIMGTAVTLQEVGAHGEDGYAGGKAHAADM